MKVLFYRSSDVVVAHDKQQHGEKGGYNNNVLYALKCWLSVYFLQSKLSSKYNCCLCGSAHRISFETQRGSHHYNVEQGEGEREDCGWKGIQDFLPCMLNISSSSPQNSCLESISANKIEMLVKMLSI